MVNQDLRNHGQSFHAPEHNYSVMAEDVQQFIDQQKLDKCVLIGHSMYVSLGSPQLPMGNGLRCPSILTKAKGCQSRNGSSSPFTRACLSTHPR